MTAPLVDLFDCVYLCYSRFVLTELWPSSHRRPWSSLFKALDVTDCFVRVPGEIKRSRDLRGGRWSWTLTFAQKRS